MQDKDESLTDEQRELVESNHNLIYKFADQNDIDIEEYYDVLAIGLCNAAKSFDNNKAKFSTLSYKCMMNEFSNTMRKEHGNSSIPDNALVYYDEAETVKEEPCVIRDICDSWYTVDGVMTESLLRSLNEQERVILYHLMNELTYEEIASEINCTTQNVCARVKEIRKKTEYFLY